MLGKSMEVSTLSLVYPDKEDPVQAEQVPVDKLKKEGIFNVNKEKLHPKCEGKIEGRKQLVKLKKCLERKNHLEFVQRKPTIPYYEEEGEDRVMVDSISAPMTDWDLITHEDHRQAQPHHHFHGCKYKTSDLARYIKHRQVLGEYDLFSGTAKNADFLEDVVFDDEDEDDSEPEETDELDVFSSLKNENNPEEFGHTGNPPNDEAKPTSPSSGSFKKSVSHIALRNPSMVHRHSNKDVDTVNDNVTDQDDDQKELSVSQVESWVMTWTYSGLSWTQSREVNQKLLDEARELYSTVTQNNSRRKSFVDNKKTGQSKEPEVITQAQKDRKDRHQKSLQQKKRIPESFRIAIPVLPKAMKEGLRGTSGHFDLVFDNITLPINYFDHF